MLAKTYLKMGDKESARKWLNKLLKYPVKTEDDANVSLFVTGGGGEFSAKFLVGVCRPQFQSGTVG